MIAQDLALEGFGQSDRAEYLGAEACPGCGFSIVSLRKH